MFGQLVLTCSRTADLLVAAVSVEVVAPLALLEDFFSHPGKVRKFQCDASFFFLYKEM